MEGINAVPNNVESSQIVVRSFQDFQSNCSLLESGLVADYLDPLPELLKLMTWVEWIKAGNGTAEHNTYFCSRVLPSITRGLLRRKYHLGNPAHPRAVQGLFYAVLGFIASRTPSAHAELDALLDPLFDENQSFYQTFGHEEQLARIALSAAGIGANKSNASWRDEVVVGMRLRVRSPKKRAVPSGSPTLAGASVIEVSPTGTEVKLLMDGEEVPEWRSVDDDDLFPDGEQSPAVLMDGDDASASGEQGTETEIEDDWRQSLLSVGAMCDALHYGGQKQQWCQAMVLGVRRAEACSSAPAEVLMGFVGWYSRMDEWMPLDSPRLAPLDTKSLAQRGSGLLRKEMLAAADETALGALLRDRTDDGSRVGVTRGNTWTSSYVVDNVNYFAACMEGNAAACGGFASVLDSIQAMQKPHAIVRLVCFVTAVGRVAGTLSRPFVLWFIPRLRSVVASAVTSLDMEELRALSKDSVDAMVRGMEFLLRRLGPRGEACRFVEDVRLKVSETFLRSALFSRRLDGVKLLVELTRMTTDAMRYPEGVKVVEGAETDLNRFDYSLIPVARGYGRREMAQWIEGARLVQEVYDSQRWHDELIERFGEVAGFLAKEECLSDASLHFMWEAAQMEGKMQARGQATALLITLCSSLDVSRLEWLLRSASCVEESGGVSSLELVKAICVRCAEIARTGASPSLSSAADGTFARGLDILWRTACGGGGGGGGSSGWLPTKTREDVAVDLLKEVIALSSPSSPPLSSSSPMNGGVSQEGGDSASPAGGVTPATDDPSENSELWEAYRSRNDWLVQSCVEKIRNNVSVGIALDVLRSILMAFPSAAAARTRRNDAEAEEQEEQDMDHGMLVRSSVIEWLEVTVGLTDLILQSIVLLHEASRLQGNGGGGGGSGLVDNLTVRLEALSCFCGASSITLRQEHIDLLWATMNRDAICEEERALFFQWLSTCIFSTGGQSEAALAAGIPEWLLKSRLSDLTYISSLHFSPSTLQCLLRIILYVGATRAFITITSAPRPTGAGGGSGDAAAMDFQVLHLGLEHGGGLLDCCLPGLGVLWLVFLHAVHDDVVSATGDFLTRLPRHFAYPLSHDGSAGAYRSLLVEAALAEMSRARGYAMDGGKSTAPAMMMMMPERPASACSTMDRCVAMLEALVDEAAPESYGVVRPHSCLRRGAPVRVIVNSTIKNTEKAAANNKKAQLRLCVYKNDRGADLIAAIANGLDRRPQEIRVFRGGRELGDTQRSMRLEDIGLRDEEAILVCLRMSGPVKDQQQNSDMNSSSDDHNNKPLDIKYQAAPPTVILSRRREHFDLLFDVMTAASTSSATTQSNNNSKTLTDRIWRLLMRLPTSPDLYHQVLSLTSPPSLLLPLSPPSSSIALPKLHYCLQLMEYFLDPGEADPQSEEASLLSTWPSRFASSGGPSHLQRLLTEHEAFATVLRSDDGGGGAPLVSEVAAAIATVLAHCLRRGAEERSMMEGSGMVMELRQVAMQIALSLVKRAARHHHHHQGGGGGDDDAVALTTADGDAVIEHLHLWQCCVRALSSVPLTSLIESPGTRDFFREVLLCSGPPQDVAKRVRAEMMRAVRDLGSSPEATAVLINTLMSLRPLQGSSSSSWRSAEACQEYYGLMESLIGSVGAKEVRPEVAWRGWALELAAQILAYAGDGEEGEEDRQHQMEVVVREEGEEDNQRQRGGDAEKDVSGQEAVLEGAARTLTAMVFADPSLAAVLATEREGLSTTLLADFLLADDDDDGDADANSSKRPPPSFHCRGVKSRNALYGLIAVCCLSSKDTTTSIMSIIEAHHDRVSLPVEDAATATSTPLNNNNTTPSKPAAAAKPASDDHLCTIFNFIPSKDRRADVGYVGLKNLGCICYMNALLQQLYMIPSFRAGILLPPSDVDKSSDGLIEQATRMFEYLRWSERKAYNPRPWCNAFKDPVTGEPTNVLVQQDAEEFLQKLCDRLQIALQRSSTHRDFVQQTIGGLLCNQLLRQPPPPPQSPGGGVVVHESGDYVRESEEPFYCIGLEVRHQGSLERSLSHFCQGETVTGFQWDEGGQDRVTIVKRSCIKRTSDTIIFHLKRFEFNFDSMRQEKLNEEFRFPMEVDLFPYTREAGLSSGGGGDGGGGGSQPSLMYELVGVVVHTGTADSGHYYSYIREREGERRWLEFNDSTVKAYDSSKMQEDCFGGSLTVTEYDTQAKVQVERSVPITKNAYMLIYARKGAAVPPPSSFSGAMVVIPPDILFDNTRHLHAVKVFAHEHALFVSSIFEGLLRHARDGATTTTMKPQDLSRYCLISCKYMVKILARSDDVSLLGPMVATLLDIVTTTTNSNDPEARAEIARQLLLLLMKVGAGTAAHESGGDPALLVDILLTCPLPAVRKSVAHLLVGLLRCLADTESPRLLSSEVTMAVRAAAAMMVGDRTETTSLPVKEGPFSPQIAWSTCTSGVLVEVLLHTQVLHHVASGWSRSTELLDLLKAWAEARVEHRIFLIRGRAIAKLADLFMGSSSPLHGHMYPSGARSLPPASRSRPARALGGGGVMMTSVANKKNSERTAPPMGGGGGGGDDAATTAAMVPVSFVGPDWTSLLDIIVLLVRHCAVRPLASIPCSMEGEDDASGINLGSVATTGLSGGGGMVCGASIDNTPTSCSLSSLEMDHAPTASGDDVGGGAAAAAVWEPLQMDAWCRRCILAPAFYATMLQNPPRHWRHFNEVACHVAKDWAEYSNDVMKVLMSTMMTTGSDLLVEDVPYVMQLLASMLAIEDTLRSYRIAKALAFIEGGAHSVWSVMMIMAGGGTATTTTTTANVSSLSSSPIAVVVMLLSLKHIAQRQGPVASYLWETRGQWGAWTLDFLRGYLDKLRGGQLKGEVLFVPRGMEMWVEEEGGGGGVVAMAMPWLKRVEELHTFFERLVCFKEEEAQSGGGGGGVMMETEGCA